MKSEYDNLFKSLMPIALSVARSKTFYGFRRNGVDVEDLEQDACMMLDKILKKSAEVPNGKILRIAIKRDLLDVYKPRRKEAEYQYEEFSESNGMPKMTYTITDFADKIKDDDLKLYIYEAFEAGDITQAELELVDIKLLGYRQNEIAKMLDVTPGHISHMIHKICKKLEKYVK